MSAPASKLATAAALAVPEVAIPAEFLKAALRARSRPPVSNPGSLPVIEHSYLGKARVRVKTRRGVKYLEVRQPPTIGEALGVAIVVGVAAGGVLAWRALGSPTSLSGLESQVTPHSTASFPSSLNPATWRL